MAIFLPLRIQKVTLPPVLTASGTDRVICVTYLTDIHISCAKVTFPRIFLRHLGVASGEGMIPDVY